MAVNENYLEFLSEFVNDLNIHDQLPVPVSSYNVEDEELAGDFVNWLLQYLNQKHCPLGLVAPLIRSVVEEMLAFCRNDPEAIHLRDNNSGQFSQLRLMQACTARANALCVRLHHDPSLLAPPFLAPPPPHLVPVAAHGARSSQRRGMEDRHVVVHDFNAVFNVQDDTSASYYAVFDGHAGQDAAVFSAAHVHQFIAESRFYPADPVNALKDAILRTDDLYLKKVKYESRFQSGTTALCTLLRGRMLHVAWVGDSQAVLVKKGRAQMLVDPHKPKRPDEERRITALGGLVLFHGMWRVNGQLAVSRAIGDPNFKPYVSAEAEVRSVVLDGDEDLLIMASDGLLDFVTPQQAAAAALQQLQDNPDNINAVCSRLINLAKKQGSTDDISVIVVFLTEPRELAKRPVPSSIDMEDLVDTSPINGTNNQWFTEKPATEESKKTKQNGGSGGFHHNLFDMGPETDVDRLDESDDDGSQDGARRNPFSEEVELRRIQQQQPEFDAARHPREETPTPPADEVPAVGSEDNAAESGDESEEEWKYFSVEPTKPTNNIVDQQLLPEHQQSTASENPFIDNKISENNPFDLEKETNEIDFVKQATLSEFEQLTDPSEFERLTDPTEFENLTNPTTEFENLTNPIEASFENPTGFSDFENVLPCKVGDFETLLASTREEEDSKEQEHFVSKEIKEEENFETKINDEHNQLLLEPPRTLLIETQGVEEDNMDSQLNPDAAEFVPVSPTREVPAFCGSDVPVLEQPSFGMDEQQQFPSAPVYTEENIFEPDRHTDFISQDEMMMKGEKVESPVVQEFAAPPVIQDLIAEAPEIQDFTSELQELSSPVLQDFAPPQENQDLVPPQEIQDFTSDIQELSSPVINDFAAPPVLDDFAPQEFVPQEIQDLTSEIQELSSPVLQDFAPPQENQDLVSPQEMQDFVPPQEIQDFAPPQEIQDFAPPQEVHDFTSEIQDLSAPIIQDFAAPSVLQDLTVPQVIKDFNAPQDFMEPPQIQDFTPEIKELSLLEVQDFVAAPSEIQDFNASPEIEDVITSPQQELNIEPLQDMLAPISEQIENLQITPDILNFCGTIPPTECEQEISPEPKEEPMYTQEVVQTPNFSVAQGPTFPVVENIVTPEEESSATSPVAVETVPETIPEEVPEPQIAICPAFPGVSVPEVTPEEIETVTELVDKMSVEHKEIPVAEIAAVAAVGAAAVAAAAAAVKTAKKPTSPTKASSPTKDKAPIAKKTTVTQSKPAGVAKTSPAKAPLATKTAASTVKAAPKPAPSKAPARTVPLVKKTAPTTTTTAPPKPKPAVPSTTRAPTRPASGLTSPTKPTAPRPKPATSTLSKPTEAKKPLTNGDAAKPAPKRPISASLTSKPAPRPTSAAPKPPTTRPVTTTLPAKTPPRPRPASAAVNGVASKPKVETATKTAASPRPAATTRRVLPPKSTVPAAKPETKQPISRTTKTTLTTKTTPGKPLVAASKKPQPVTKVAPTKTTSKTVKTETPVINGDAPVLNGDKPAVNGDVPINGDAVNGDSHHDEVSQLIEAPSLVALE